MAKKITSPFPRHPTFIRQWRDFRGLTLEQLAERIESTKASVQRIETGEQPYSQDTLEYLAVALDCSPVDLLSRDPSAQPDFSLFEIGDLPSQTQKEVADFIRGKRLIYEADKRAEPHIEPADEVPVKEAPRARKQKSSRDALGKIKGNTA